MSKIKKNSQQTERDVTRNPADLGSLGLAIVRSLPVGIIVFDTDLKIIEANPCAAALIELNDCIDKSLAEGTDHKIWSGWTQQLKSAISKDQVSRFNEVAYTCGQRKRLLQIILTPVKQSKTKIHGGIILIEDITERITLQRQLTNSEKLASIGKLASKVAHELNNPLDGILRYINLTIRILEQENLDKPQKYLKECRQGLMRMAQITGELLEFSRRTYTQIEEVTIEHIIEDALKTMMSKIEVSNIRIMRDYRSGLPKIRTGNLFQVFCNLIKNAIDAMPDGGQLKIKTSVNNDDTIIIEFKDTGTGLPQENIESIFEPFFTTKEKDKGTGLGLAVCRDIIENYNGRITAENAPEGGSVFTVFLPANN